MEKKFDPTKPVQTRDGRKARIVDTNYKDILGHGQIVAIISEPSGYETLVVYCDDGQMYEDRNAVRNLVNVPEKRGFWVNFYSDWNRLATLHPSREEADAHAGVNVGADRVACKYVEFEEGEGV
jgi:hypothetical protein